MRPFALALLLLSAEAYRSGDAKRAARAGASAPEELKDRQHVVDELSGCIASLNSETKALSHAIGVIATLSGDLGADLAHYMPTTPFHQSFVLIGELNAFATNIEQHGAHCLEEKLAKLMSLGVRPGTADDVPPFVLAAAATVRLSAGAMRQLLLRFFLVPSSGYAQATTLLRRINAYLASQWLSISSTAALRNGPYGAIGEWAAKELPKAIVG